MSHIYEALRRASESPVADVREPARAQTPASALEHYSGEGRQSSDRSDGTRVPRPDPPEIAVPETARRHRLGRAGAGYEDKLVAGRGSASVSAEHYRSLAATLHEAQGDRGLKTVVVTSTVRREGKTLTVVNLALTLSESYARRVLVIDADLRGPSVHHVLGVPNETGLSEALVRPRGPLPLIDVSSLLSVLPAGHPEPNPLARLSSGRMQALLDECASRFDWVLVDTPPVGVMADAQLLARQVQAVVFVIGAGAAPFSLVEKAIAELGRECIIGTVLNGVDESRLPATSAYGQYPLAADPAR